VIGIPKREIEDKNGKKRRKRKEGRSSSKKETRKWLDRARLAKLFQQKEKREAKKPARWSAALQALRIATWGQREEDDLSRQKTGSA